MNSHPTSSLLSGKITDLAFGGEGILRQEGCVVFVPFVVPGDEITCQLVQKKKSFVRANLIEVQVPSSDRIKPLCPHFGLCGGCQLQHLNYQAQLEAKQKWVQDALIRIGGMNVSVNPIHPAVQQWAYRRHIHLKLRPKNHTFEAGYITTDHHSLLQIQECPIFLSSKELLLKEIQEFVGKIPSNGSEEGKLTLLKQDQGQFFLHFHFKYLPSNIEELIQQAASQHSHWQSITVSSMNKTITVGEKYAQVIIEGILFQYSARAFMQNHPEQSLNIYTQILNIADQTKPQHILDLYCGIGISSLLLAKRNYSVTGVELNREAIQLAKQNAKENTIKKAKFLQGDVKDLLPSLIKQNNDFVIINPPREGLYPEVVDTLVNSPVKNLIYISCMPSTLARDLKKLSQKYEVVSCQPYDMFPQTAHVETVIHLRPHSFKQASIS